MSWWRGVYRNRKSGNCATSSTEWIILGLPDPTTKAITGYTSYGALLTAGDTAFPGSPEDFPTGAPVALLRSQGASQADGSAFNVKTNTIATPNSADLGDDLVSGSGQTVVWEGVGVKSVWVKKKTAGDAIIATAMY